MKFASFRKALSLVCAMALILSAMAVVFTFGASAEDVTLESLGFNSADKNGNYEVYYSPDRSGEQVVRVHNALYAPTISIVALEDFTPGATYTVSFKYWQDSAGLVTEANATAVANYQLYYGMSADNSYDDPDLGEPVTVGKTSLKSPVSVLETTDEWVEVSFDITPNAVTKTVGEKSYTYENIYLSYYSAQTVEDQTKANETNFYIKDLSVVQQKIVRYSPDMNNLINHQVKAANGTSVTGTPYGSSLKDYWSMTNDGYFRIGSSSNTVDLPTSFPTAGWYQHVPFLRSTTAAYSVKAGVRYYVSVEYTVDAFNTELSFGIGVCTSNTYDSQYANKTTRVYAANKHTAADVGKAFTVAADFTPTADASCLRLAISGQNSYVVVKSINVSYAIDPTEVALITYNDNGDISSDLAVIGESLKQGENGLLHTDDYNNSEKEQFIGWYSDANLTTAVTTCPATDTKLYAKYPSIVIDFNNIKDAWYDTTKTSSAAQVTVADGILTSTLSSGLGFMIPAYDDNDAGSFQFIKNKNYNFTIVYRNATAAKLVFTPASGYGTGYTRYTSGERSATSFFTTGSGETAWKTNSYRFAYFAGTLSSIATNGTVGCGLRNSSAKMGVEIDKIIVYSEADKAYMPDLVTLAGNSVVNDTKLIVPNGQFAKIPTPAATDNNKLFVGWYKSTPPAGTSDTGYTILPQLYIDSDNVAYGDTAVTAHWVDKETVIEWDADYDDITSNYISTSSLTMTKDDTTTSDYDGVIEFTGSGAANAYRVELYNNGAPYIAYEGVTYEYKIDYDASAATGNCVVAPVREIEGNAPVAFDSVGFHNGFGSNSSQRITLDKNQTQATLTQTAQGMYNRYTNGNGTLTRLKNIAALEVRSSKGLKIYRVTITAKAWAPTIVDYDSEKIESVDVNYVKENGKNYAVVTATPKAGYAIAYNGIKLSTIYNTSTSANVTSVVKAATNAVGSANTYKFSIGDYDLNEAQIIVTAVDEATAGASMGTIASSIRKEVGAGDAYVSAGIRFRGRIGAELAEGAQEIGFIVIPTSQVPATANLENLLACDYAAIAKNKVSDKNVVYDQLGNVYYDYQAIITGLTKEGQTTNLLDLELSVYFYVIDANGEGSIAAKYTDSYNAVLARLG